MQSNVYSSPTLLFVTTEVTLLPLLHMTNCQLTGVVRAISARQHLQHSPMEDWKKKLGRITARVIIAWITFTPPCHWTRRGGKSGDLPWFSHLVRQLLNPALKQPLHQVQLRYPSDAINSNIMERIRRSLQIIRQTETLSAPPFFSLTFAYICLATPYCSVAQWFLPFCTCSIVRIQDNVYRLMV